MNLTVAKSDLVRELGYVREVSDQKNAIPALGSVKLEATKLSGSLHMSTTDLDLSLKTYLGGSVQAAGEILIPAKKLYEIAKALPDGDVTIKVDAESWVRIEAGSTKLKIAGLPGEEFPKIPTLSGEAIEIPGDVLLDLIGRTEFAITTEDVRYQLAGALLVLDKDALAMVATDGHRLAYAHRAAALKLTEPQRVLVPRKAISELGRLISAGEVVKLYIGDHLGFEVAGRTLTAKRIEGQFPDHTKVIDKGGDKSFAVSTAALSSALKRMGLMSTEKSRSVKLTLNGDLRLESGSPDIGSGAETIDVHGTGETQAAFNVEYLLDFCGAAGTDEVKVTLGDSETQAVLEPVGSETEYKYVVMPMRL